MASPQSVMESEKEINNNDEQVKTVIEVMAANGKYWHDWDKLKGMLSFHLKKVLSDYPEASMTTEQQQSCIGESFPELVKRLDNERECERSKGEVELMKEEEVELSTALMKVLHLRCKDFVRPYLWDHTGILLDARSIYPKLSKLALALEKNLLVTSTLTVSSEPHVSSNMEDATEPEKPYVSSNMQDATEPEKPYVSSNMQDATEPEKPYVLSNMQDATEPEKPYVLSNMQDATEPEKPYVSSNMQDATEPESETKASPVQSNSVSNGVEPTASAGDADEVMAEVEEAEVEDVMTIDMDTIEAIVRSSEADTAPASDS